MCGFHKLGSIVPNYTFFLVGVGLPLDGDDALSTYFIFVPSTTTTKISSGRCPVKFRNVSKLGRDSFSQDQRGDQQRKKSSCVIGIWDIFIFQQGV